MTKKERILVVLRFVRLHWWRFVLAFVVAFAVGAFLYNLPRIIPWFSSSLASSSVKQSLSVKGGGGSSNNKDSKNDVETIPSEVVPYVPPVPQIRLYVVEDRRIYTDIGFVPFGGVYRDLRLVRINRKAGQVFFSAPDGTCYVVGLDGVVSIVQDFGNSEKLPGF